MTTRSISGAPHTHTARRVAGRVLMYALLVLLAFASVFPLYWLVVSSFKDVGEIYSPTLIPLRPTLDNYTQAIGQIPIFRMLANSIVVSLAITACQLVTAVLLSYAAIRWNFRGKTLVTVLLSLTWLVPFQAIMVPNYVQINAWGLKGNPAAIVLPYMASAFACIGMCQSFEAFPKALLDAARLEGRSELRILTGIVLPNMRSTIASFGILLFITSWNEYMWPMLVVNGIETAPIQIGLRSFVGSDTNMWGSLMAATTISCIPIFVLYLFLQRRIVDSFMKWGIK